MLAWWALPARWQRVPVALGLVMAVAVADEVLQSFHPTRTGRLTDLLVDLVGALLGLWVAGAFRRPSARETTSDGVHLGARDGEEHEPGIAAVVSLLR